MNIGKYQVDGHAVGNQEAGFKGAVTRTWDEGNETLEQYIEFDRVFHSMEDAIAHAYEQAHHRVSSGDW